MINTLFGDSAGEESTTVQVLPLPGITPEMSGATLSQWHVEEGSTVAKGAVLCEIENDLLTADLESPQAGTVLYLGAEPGEWVEVGGVVAIVGEPGTDIEPILEEYTGQMAEYVLSGYVGEVKMWSGDFVPDGWLPCDGRDLSAASFPDLFDTVGHSYGTGEKEGHFCIPQLAALAGVQFIICYSGAKVARP